MSTRNNSKANRSLKKSKEAKGFSSQKSLLPSIKDPISPGLFNSSISHKDLSKTPKIIRKQATFKYFPNIEESKSQFRSEENKSLTNRDTFDINFSGKTASKSAISKNEIGKLSSLLIEKEAIISDLKSKIHDSLSHEVEVPKSHFFHKSNEEISKLEAKNQNFSEIFKIKSHENELLRIENNLLHTQIKTLEIQQKFSKKGENNGEFLKEELDLKNKEISQYVEIIVQLDSEKKESDEKIWNLETKLKKIKDKTDDFCELERKLKSNARELESEKEKGKKMKTQIKALQDANAKYVTSQKELENVNCELSEEHKNLQFFFTNYKEKLQETEGKLRISIEKLSGKDQIDASGQGEKVNSRRNLAHSTNVESLQTSNQTRLFHKISILEEEIATCNNEIEKLSKTALFYKQSCEEKSRILAQIELLTEKNIQDRVNALRNSLIRSLQNHCNSIEENNLSIIDSLKCKNCESNEAIEYISWPCEHSFCSSCITFESTCKICSSTSQLLKLPHFIQIFSKLSQEKLSQNKVKSILSSF